MKYIQVILWSMLLLMSCQNTSPPLKPAENLILNHLDLYPKYPTCPNYYEKKQQLNCLRTQIYHFLSEEIKALPKKQFIDVQDSLWLKFRIDTLGLTHLIKITFKHAVKKDTILYPVFNKIAHKIPQMQPAIYHDQPVNFEFKIPVYIQSIEKSDSND